MSQKPQMVEVTLKKEHTHNHTKYPADSVISVRVADVPFLEKNKIIDVQSVAEVGTAAKKAAEEQQKASKETEARFASIGNNGGVDVKVVGKENK